MVWIGGGLAAVQGLFYRREIEAGGLPLAQERDRVVVRAHPAIDVTVAKARRIKQRTQIRLAVLGIERRGGGKPPGLLRPIDERRAAQIAANLVQRRPLRPEPLALGEHD